MGRHQGAVCRLCRREELKLFLKGKKCLTAKCTLEKRNFPPGEKGKMRKKQTEYGIQLREKQKLRRIYGLLEQQFSNYFKKASKKTGKTGEVLLQFLERRLDSVVYRLGFASSRTQARQYVSHKHFLVNGRSVNIPSYLIKEGDEIKLKESSRTQPFIVVSLAEKIDSSIPEWMQLDKANFTGRITKLPTRSQIDTPVREQLVVEFYSR